MNRVNLFFLVTAALSLIACDEYIKGNGNVIEKTHPVEAFTSLSISGIYDVELVPGKSKLTILADENLHEYISFKVDDNNLDIHSNNKFLNGEQLKLTVFYNKLDELALTGASSVFSSETIKGEKFEIDVSGATELELSVKLKKLIMDLSGGSELYLSGSAEDVILDVSGAAEINAEELMAENVSIDITGAGEVSIGVQKTLNVDVSGAGEVKYIGDPKVTQNISGAGEVKKISK
ncbi:MAG: head GIN domain-containing protein [Salibacteraceae bacterium]